MSVQLRVIVREGDNGGPLIPGAIVQVEAAGTMDMNGKTSIAVAYLTVTAPGFTPYVHQPYAVESLASVIPIALQRAVAPPTPTPVPTTPAPNPHHVTPGPLTVAQAQAVILACAQEFPQLLQVFPTDQAASDACTEFLLRVIWHLKLYGFTAARQKNPSGVISGDKLCVTINGAWRAFDIGSIGYAGHATTIQVTEVTPANPVPDPGTAD